MTTKKRNIQADGLKGAAILLVVIFHFFGRYAEIYPVDSMLPLPLLRKAGMTGVAVFFAVSGYYMVSDRGGLYFAAKRIARLWPVYMLGITACFLLTRYFPLPGRTVTLKEYIFNIPFVNGYINMPYVDGAHWYITDLIGCIFVYAFINKTRDIKDRIAAVAFFWMLSMVLGYCTKNYAGNKILDVLFGLIGSGRLAMVLSGEAVRHLTEKRYKTAVIIEILAAVHCLSYFGAFDTAVMVLVQPVLWLAAVEYIKLPLVGPLSKLGEASYSIFVFHQNIGYIIIFYASQLTGKYSLWLSAAAAVIMLSVGLTVFACIEKPCDKLLNAVENKISEKILRK